jgi:hypothetical protein
MILMCFRFVLMCLMCFDDIVFSMCFRCVFDVFSMCFDVSLMCFWCLCVFDLFSMCLMCVRRISCVFDE